MNNLVIALLLLVPFCVVTVCAQEHDDHAHGPLHFSHPIITESASPDTKLRFDYGFQRFSGEQGDQGNDHTSRVEFEYALNKNVSVSVTTPFTFRRPEVGHSSNHLDNVEVSLKAVTYR